MTLFEAVKGIDDDYMTSENHHPHYVLIPTTKFNMIVEAIEIHKSELEKWKESNEAHILACDILRNGF